MTNEEAIKILKKARLAGIVDADINHALDMAIKALGSWEKYSDELWKKAYARGCNDVLDKIRAEIASYGAIWIEYIIPGHTDRDIEKIVENVLREAKEQVLSIIDKYKVESEDKE